MPTFFTSSNTSLSFSLLPMMLARRGLYFCCFLRFFVFRCDTFICPLEIIKEFGAVNQQCHLRCYTGKKIKVCLGKFVILLLLSICNMPKVFWGHTRGAHMIERAPIIFILVLTPESICVSIMSNDFRSLMARCASVWLMTFPSAVNVWSFV